MSAFTDAESKYVDSKWDIAESHLAIGALLTKVYGTPFNAATVAQHDAMMSKIQMHARKIVEASIDAQVECGIAAGEKGE